MLVVLLLTFYIYDAEAMYTTTWCKVLLPCEGGAEIFWHILFHYCVKDFSSIGTAFSSLSTL